jgi:flagellar M-ring protein FliF
MTAREHAGRLVANMRELGTRRLVALGVIGLAVMLLVGLGAYYLSTPEKAVLYSDLSHDDVNRIGSALREAGIGFDVSADGATVLVGHSETAEARMLLAEKGLPQSSSSGYELFNELGSFGLTSFMQEVTRVRALEGELARTIQTLKGVKAARVHIVLPDRASFRREQQPASASVVIRTENANDAGAAQAIRHLVAAAVPGMKADSVTVLSTDGSVLASGDDVGNAAAGKLSLLEQGVSEEIEENVRRTLSPYLGLDNFEVSVAPRLNTDKTTVSATSFDPDSRVERSVRTVRENDLSQNRSTEAPTTVQQNIPEEQVTADNGSDSTEESTRREDLTNYEISSTVTQTVRDGYTIEHLSVAVLVNRDRLDAITAAGGPAVDAQLAEIEQLVSSAAGVDQPRGDQVKVAAVAFVDGGQPLEATPPLPFVELLLRQSGTLINALTILVVAALLIWFGLKPAVRSILTRPESPAAIAALTTNDAGVIALPGDAATASLSARADVSLIEDLTSRMNRSPQRRLEQIVELNEEQAAAVLRHWMRQEERA